MVDTGDGSGVTMVEHLCGLITNIETSHVEEKGEERKHTSPFRELIKEQDSYRATEILLRVPAPLGDVCRLCPNKERSYSLVSDMCS